jgi:acetolactate synthase-1/2/3 large subunit
MDSVPIVAITGQVPSSLIGTDGFPRRTSAGSRCRSLHNYLVDAADIPRTVAEAFHIGRYVQARPGAR